MKNADIDITPAKNDDPATPSSTRDGLIGDQTRRGPSIRSAFLQQRGGARTPGPLSQFVEERRLFALQLYLFFHCLARADPWDVRLPAAVWARALNRTNKGAESTVSRSWTWLADKNLVATERKKRVVSATLKLEDGSGGDYARSTDFFQLPLAFFRDEWHTKLKLPGTAVLLIALDKSWRKPWFELRTEPQSKWYGMSPDTLQRGLDELREAGLMQIHRRQVHDARARLGTTPVNEYRLLGSFATRGSNESLDALDELL
jgi:DNA-binding transcriptional ArsR family regulator